MKLEICVDSLESAKASQSGGADRIELCSALADGGLTPSAGLIGAVRSGVNIDVYLMIRPRAGDFVYTDEEFDVMREDVSFAKRSGVDGVVFGLLTTDGLIDVIRTRALVEAARPMKVTFHRAFDLSLTLEPSLEDVILTGADTLLTSGGAPAAVTGLSSIAKIVGQANRRIGIMVGGGVRAGNVSQIIKKTGATEFHAALRRELPSPMLHRNRAINLGQAGRDEYTRQVAFREDVRTLRSAIDSSPH